MWVAASHHKKPRHIKCNQFLSFRRLMPKKVNVSIQYEKWIVCQTVLTFIGGQNFLRYVNEQIIIRPIWVFLHLSKASQSYVFFCVFQNCMQVFFWLQIVYSVYFGFKDMDHNIHIASDIGLSDAYFSSKLKYQRGQGGRSEVPICVTRLITVQNSQLS